MGYKVAIVGATGNVGREMLNILAERAFPVSEVVALASSRSIGQEVSFGDKTLKIKVLDHYDFTDTDICLMSAGGEISKAWSPKIGAQGCVVIDDEDMFIRHSGDIVHGQGLPALPSGGKGLSGRAMHGRNHFLRSTWNTPLPPLSGVA